MGDSAIIGVACALPGARSPEDFWSLLVERRNTVCDAPRKRWNVERFFKPGASTPGFSYTFAGGYLDDPLLFDPAPFGVSPREVQQIDPQQRLLLELVWHAFEDAGLAFNDVRGRNVGVFVGASTVDYMSAAIQDLAAMESHFMTGNSLSILANRISYAFDLRGPSLTIDTACSSSLVAMSQALAALDAGRVEMAVVAGVNLLLSPVPFIGFSQARMLSPTGRSRPFSRSADGYVRAEGGVAMVLRRLDDAVGSGDHIRSVVLGADVNTDGRTAGIWMPSAERQTDLIHSLYDRLSIPAEHLAFVEAHGTGTPVGDPLEATALGEALGAHRSRPLIIGSAKSNVGHLEAASGLVGLLKATLSLENGVYPASLYSDDPTDAVDLAAMNLQLAQDHALLERAGGDLLAGVCNYGFGGVNAHVVVRAARQEEVAPAQEAGARYLLVTAATREALAARAGQIADELASGRDAPQLGAALGWRQQPLAHSFAIPLSAGDPVRRLRAMASEPEAGHGAAAVRRGSARTIAFVFSGNGCQFPHMGQAAYRADSAFREEIDDIDSHFSPLAGWSLAARMREGIDAESLARTSVAQPLIYAIQSALAALLGRLGILPEVVLGHSVGEVAAAEAGGVLSRKDAVALILARSLHQEEARGGGGMMAVAASEETTLAEIGAAGGLGLEIAAVNSPASTTVVGSREDLEAFAAHCRHRRLATILLDIDYPFHSSSLDPLRRGMIAALDGLSPQPCRAAFVSSVEGGPVPGSSLGAEYWWRNLRQPVRFQDAVVAAAGLGANLFVEISPRAILNGVLQDIMRAKAIDASALSTLSAVDDEDQNPCEEMIARLLAHGASANPAIVFGHRPPGSFKLPPYPFQRSQFLLPQTSEALRGFGFLGSEVHHPLLGARSSPSSMEWRGYADAGRVPYLAEHRVDGVAVAPAATLIEMALSVGAQVFGPVALEIDEFDVVRALSIAEGETREVVTRWSENTGVVEIRSRTRFSQDEWALHARGFVRRIDASDPEAPPEPTGPLTVNTSQQIYSAARRAGLEYGPAFQIAEQVERDARIGNARLSAPVGGLGAYEDRHAIHPISLDAALHPLFLARPQADGETVTHLPVRFRKVRLFRHGAAVRRANTRLLRETDRSKSVAITLWAADGSIALTIESVVLRTVVLSRSASADRTFFRDVALVSSLDGDGLLSRAMSALAGRCIAPPPPEHRILRALGLSLARRLAETASQITARKGPEAPEAASVAYADVLGRALRAYAPDGGAEARALPAPEALLATLVHSFPAAALEAQMAASAIAHAPRLLSDGAFAGTPSLMRRWAGADPLMGPLAVHVAEAVRAAAAGAGRPLRLLALEPFSGALIRALRGLIADRLIDITFAAASADDLSERRRLSPSGAYGYLDLSRGDAWSPAPFDIFVCVAQPQPLGSLESSITSALRHMAGGAPVIVVAPTPDPAMDVVLGVWEAMAPRLANHADAGARWPSLVAGLLRANDLADVSTYGDADGSGHIIIASASRAESPCEPERAVCIASDREVAVACGLAHATVVASDAPTILTAAAGEGSAHVYLTAADSLDSPTESLAARIEQLRAVLGWARDRAARTRITVLTRGGDDLDPVEAGLRGLVRVAMNEYPDVDIRILDAPAAPDPDAMRLALGAAAGERELTVTEFGLAATRVRPDVFSARALGPDERSVLEFPSPGRFDGLSWTRHPRKAPQGGEIEVEVRAAGLNFRDVLVGLGILDDDLLGAGLTGAALGFECAGVVVRVGEGVEGLAVGDCVMGLAAGAFTSHVTAPCGQFFRAPAGLGYEAAATIPVAFATAWHALVERAGLKAGEDVLIHGGAGGLGIAAIQIAKMLGARVLATAGDPSRRAIARACGADLVFESRGERFAPAIAEAVGGVDVALNSLAGPAMLATLRLVKPFGRFIEVGKRDYLDNTHVALRPFVRNITYAGVDLDDLLRHDPAAAGRMMQALTAGFERGDLRPPPYVVFEGDEAAAAFRTMQASEHVGKVVVRPPLSARPEPKSDIHRVRAGAYLVVGGASGLGLETALWLAGRGATTIIIASRRGSVDARGAERIEDCRRSGVAVQVERLDVTDAEQVSALVARIEASGEPLRGVVHAAVHLDDGLIAGLEPDRLRAVLRVKVDGAVNLDQATRRSSLDFFLLYSSAAALVGSPGQGAYVAANSFLEGLATLRRRQGRPALAIGWGAVGDAGMVARDKALGERLRRTTGVSAIKSSEAMAFLGRILALGPEASPVQYYANVAATPAASKMALLMSPAFGAFDLYGVRGAVAHEQDLAAMVLGKPASEGIAIVSDALRREIAKILRMPESQISDDRALLDLGFDSLMALELQLAVERLCGTQLPFVGTSERSVSGLAAALLARLVEAAPSAIDDDGRENIAPAVASEPGRRARLRMADGVSHG